MAPDETLKMSLDETLMTSADETSMTSSDETSMMSSNETSMTSAAFLEDEGKNMSGNITGKLKTPGKELSFSASKLERLSKLQKSKITIQIILMVP